MISTLIVPEIVEYPDLKADPGQMKNVAADHADVIRDLLAHYASDLRLEKVDERYCKPRLPELFSGSAQ